jgi:hypothetical protein
MVDTIYWSVIPPRPQCQRCGAYAAEDHGPVIPMESPSRQYDWYGTTTDNKFTFYKINSNK